MKNNESFINELSNFKNICIAGVSRKKKFGNMLYSYFKKLNYKVTGVNPNLNSIMDDKCYHSLSDLPEKPELVIIATNPKHSKSILEECNSLGITRVFFTFKSETKELIDYCKEKNIRAVFNSCPFMFFDPKGVHKFHKFISDVFKIKPKIV